MKHKEFPIIAYIFIAIVIWVGVFSMYSTKVHKTSDVDENVIVPPTQVPIQSSGYTLSFLDQVQSLKPKFPITLKFILKDSHGGVEKKFTVAHDKLLHLVVVRKDLQYFQHLHPQYDPNSGEFTQVVTFPTDGMYLIYADFMVDGAEKSEIVKTSVNVGDLEKYQPQPIVDDAVLIKEFLPYSVKFFLTPIHNGNELGVFYSEYVERSGAPVMTLQPYLGAKAHSILINTETFEYIHVHAQDPEDMGHMSHMGSMSEMNIKESSSGPWINFQTSIPRSGIYKIFTEFQDQGHVTLTEFVVSL